MKLSKKYHPDKGGDQVTYKNITFAYQILKNHKQRQLYD